MSHYEGDLRVPQGARFAIIASRWNARIVDALVATGLEKGRSAARRTVASGGAYLNNVKVADADAVLSEDDLLGGRFAIVRRGKKTVGAVEIQR